MGERLCRRVLRQALALDQLIPKVPPPARAPEPRPDRAVLCQALLNTGQVRTRADLATALGCSRAWVTKVRGPSGTLPAHRREPGSAWLTQAPLSAGPGG